MCRQSGWDVRGSNEGLFVFADFFKERRGAFVVELGENIVEQEQRRWEYTDD